MKNRSERYKKTREKVDKQKEYSIPEAIKLAKETSYANFEGTLELHLNLNIDPGDSSQRINFTTIMPNETGKSRKILVIASPDGQKEAKEAGAEHVGGKEMVKAIKEEGFNDFDIVIATPDMMSEIAEVAPILGPKGMMPNPKNNTVTEDVVKAIERLRSGQITLKTDKFAELHLPVGKENQKDSKIRENIEHVLENLQKQKPPKVKGGVIKTAYLCATMGPSIKLKIKTE